MECSDHFPNFNLFVRPPSLATNNLILMGKGITNASQWVKRLPIGSGRSAMGCLGSVREWGEPPMGLAGSGGQTVEKQ